VDDLNVLLLERRCVGLAGFLCLCCRAAYRRACLRGDVGGCEHWLAGKRRWDARYRAARRRRDGLCGGR
jgi:hypothetical protein